MTKDGKSELVPLEDAVESADAEVQPVKKARKKWTRQAKEVELHEV